MKKLLLSLFIFLFIITSSQKSALVGSWQDQNGDVITFSTTHISSSNKDLPYRYLTDNTILVIADGKANKIGYLLSFDKNRLSIFGKSYVRAHPVR